MTRKKVHGMKRLCMAAALLACSLAHAQFKDERTPKKAPETAAAATAQRPGPSAAASASAAAPAPAKTYFLDAADKNLRTTFARWARERGTTVQWLLNEDVPIDGTGPVRNTYPDLNPQLFAQSSYPDLVEAMTVVAYSFVTSRTPFVVRERDNTILVQPRLSVRQ